MATDQAVIAVDCDHSVKGHRRALEEFDPSCGFRVWEVVPSPAPVATFGTRVFGLSQGAAIPNLALVWPQRFTWHSDFQVCPLRRLCTAFRFRVRYTSACVLRCICASIPQIYTDVSRAFVHSVCTGALRFHAQ